MDKQLSQYLDESWRVFSRAATTNANPVLLCRMGGVLYIAGVKADEIRTEKEAYLGFIDRDRDYKERLTLAAGVWHDIKGRIVDAVDRGVPPRKAIEDTFAAYGTVAHTPEKIQLLLQQAVSPAGQDQNWFMDFRDRDYSLDQRLGTMGTSALGATAAVFTLVATSKDWEHATPEEWERAGRVGALAANVEAVAAPFALAREAKTASENFSRDGGGHDNYEVVSPDSAKTGSRVYTSPASRGAEQRSVTDVTRGTAAPTSQAPSSQGQAGPASSAPVLARPASKSRPQAPAAPPQVQQARGVAPANRGARGVSANTDEDVEQAFGEHALSTRGSRTTEPSPMHRSGALAGTRQQSLDLALPANQTRQQRDNARRLINRFSTTVQNIWREATNGQEAETRLAKVRTLWYSNDAKKMQEARKFARDAIYAPWLRRFLRRLRKRVDADPSFASMFTDAGLQFDPDKKNTAPFWLLPNGTRQELTVDHITRVQDDPTRCVDPTNMQFSPRNENSHWLELIRNNDPFQLEGTTD